MFLLVGAGGKPFPSLFKIVTLDSSQTSLLTNEMKIIELKMRPSEKREYCGRRERDREKKKRLRA